MTPERRSGQLSHLYHKVIDTIKKYDLINENDNILVAVSGGPDSVALFRIIHEIANHSGQEVQIFHLNHLIRKEASDDEGFVRDLGRQFETLVHVERSDVSDFARSNGLSLQEGAREVRYKLMEKIASDNGLNKIATGHIKDDVTETFLMRVASGSGLRGLTGIPPKRDDKYIRPLIESTKAEIMSWMEELGQRYVVDESNNSDKYFRNRIRRHVTPNLREYGIDDVVYQTCEIIRIDEGSREKTASTVFCEIASVKATEISIPIESLVRESLDIQSRVLRLSIQRLNDPYTDRPTIDQLFDVLKRLRDGSLKGLDLQGGVSVSKEGDRLVLYLRRADTSIKENELVIGRDNSISLLFSIKVELTDAVDLKLDSGTDVANLDESKIKWPLVVRSFMPGDRFIPFGMDGTKKVKDFFIDQKIPKRRRNQIPIIEDMEKIVWIAGHRSDQRVRVDKTTGKVAVLKIETRE